MQKSAFKAPEIKICGITNVEDGMLAADLGADYIGVILDDRVIRHGSQELLAELHGKVAGTVGVYTEMSEIEKSELNEDIVQIHFPHSPEDAMHVKELTGKRIISVLQYTNGQEAAKSANEFLASGSDFVLVEKRDGIFQVHSEVLKIARNTDICVAGKISPDNIHYFAESTVQMIDVSSSVESVPGRKDPEKLRELFKNAGRSI